MAIRIKSIPVLKDKNATAFIEKAYINFYQNKDTIDFSEHVKTMKAIIKKSVST